MPLSPLSPPAVSSPSIGQFRYRPSAQRAWLRSDRLVGQQTPPIKPTTPAIPATAAGVQAAIKAAFNNAVVMPTAGGPVEVPASRIMLTDLLRRKQQAGSAPLQDDITGMGLKTAGWGDVASGLLSRGGQLASRGGQLAARGFKAAPKMQMAFGAAGGASTGYELGGVGGAVAGAGLGAATAHPSMAKMPKINRFAAQPFQAAGAGSLLGQTAERGASAFGVHPPVDLSWAGMFAGGGLGLSRAALGGMAPKWLQNAPEAATQATQGFQQGFAWPAIRAWEHARGVPGGTYYKGLGAPVAGAAGGHAATTIPQSLGRFAGYGTAGAAGAGAIAGAAANYANKHVVDRGYDKYLMPQRGPGLFGPGADGEYGNYPSMVEDTISKQLMPHITNQANQYLDQQLVPRVQNYADQYLGSRLGQLGLLDDQGQLSAWGPMTAPFRRMAHHPALAGLFGDQDGGQQQQQSGQPQGQPSYEQLLAYLAGQGGGQ